MRPIVCSFLFMLALRPMDARSTGSVHPVDLSLGSFVAREERTIEVFRALARVSHIVIGVSGEWIGSDRTLISIGARHLRVRDILDEICTKDPRYKWQEAQDGNIHVSMETHRLTLDDVNIAAMNIGTVNSSELSMLISHQSQVEAWKTRSSCNIGHVFLGQPEESWHLKVDAKDEPLWKVLNEISVQNGTYFWEAIKISSAPCTISLNP